MHNGTISNCTELKKELKDKGIAFRSETDTEVIANLVSFYLDEMDRDPDSYKVRQDDNRVATAFELALNRLDGSWGTWISFKLFVLFETGSNFRSRHFPRTSVSNCFDVSGIRSDFAF